MEDGLSLTEYQIFQLELVSVYEATEGQSLVLPLVGPALNDFKP